MNKFMGVLKGCSIANYPDSVEITAEVVIENKCLFCGGEKRAYSSNPADHCEFKGLRTIYCFERELAHKDELLRKAGKLLDRAMRGGNASPGAWIQLVCDIAGFLTTPEVVKVMEGKP